MNYAEMQKKMEQSGFYSGLIELIWGILQWDRELMQEFIDSSEKAAVSSI